MGKPVQKSSPRTRPSSDESGCGNRLHHGRVCCVARMKRSAIRERSRSFKADPGFHGACHRAGHFGPDPLVPSGLRRKKRKKEKEAERRKTLFRNHRSLAGCGAAPTLTEGAARLPAFHRGSCQRDSRIPTAQLRARLRETGTESGGLPPASAGPGYSDAPRVPVIVPAG